MPLSLDDRFDELSARWDEKKPAPFRLTREVAPGLFNVRTRGSHAYLIAEERLTLIDTGSPGSARRVIEAIREIGRDPSEIETIVITHAHIDHVGGLAELQKVLPGRTAVHIAEAGAVVSGEPLPNPCTHPVIARLITPYLRRNDPGAARVDQELHDGDELPVYGGMRVVHAPGHTPGSISLHFPQRGILIVGDAMQHKFGRLLPPSRLFTADNETAQASISRLARLDFETLCFSHFRSIPTGADRRVRAFAAQLAEASPAADVA